MLRRIMIMLAASTASLALATAPAGAGAGNFEVYADPGFAGTHMSVPSTTVDDYLDACVEVATLTSSSPSTAGSTENDTDFDIELYSAEKCSGPITTVSAHSTWSSSSSTRAVSVFVVSPWS